MYRDNYRIRRSRTPTKRGASREYWDDELRRSSGTATVVVTPDLMDDLLESSDASPGDRTGLFRALGRVDWAKKPQTQVVQNRRTAKKEKYHDPDKTIRKAPNLLSRIFRSWKRLFASSSGG